MFYFCDIWTNSSNLPKRSTPDNTFYLNFFKLIFFQIFNKNNFSLEPHDSKTKLTKKNYISTKKICVCA